MHPQWVLTIMIKKVTMLHVISFITTFPTSSTCHWHLPVRNQHQWLLPLPYCRTTLPWTVHFSRPVLTFWAAKGWCVCDDKVYYKHAAVKTLVPDKQSTSKVSACFCFSWPATLCAFVECMQHACINAYEKIPLRHAVAVLCCSND